jgi:XTP/dITP diphosphohydrolase
LPTRGCVRYSPHSERRSIAAEAGARRTLLIATRSPHKLDELRALLRLPGTDLVSLDDLGIREVAREDAATFVGNAVDKARFYAALGRVPTLADDSGLEVDALDGQPGVRSHRFAADAATDEQNNEHLLELLSGRPAAERTARYRCALAFVADWSADPVVRLGTLEGRIAGSARGTGGFGYDPIFEPSTESPGGRTVGLFSQEEKNEISHRAVAARLMGDYLRSRGF